MNVVLSKNSALVRLCHSAGIDGRDARLIRICANIVFHLPRANAVVRVTSAQMAARARRAVRVAHWLQSIDFPAVRVHPAVPDAVIADGQVATFWEYLPQPAASPDVVQLAPLLQRLHAMTPLFPLPSWDPVTDARNNLRPATGVLRREDRNFLVEWCDRLDRDLPSNRYDLPHGLIHGDAWVGNLLWRDDEVVLCDLDQVSYGPREWDLVPTAVNAIRFGHPPRRFPNVYGFDVTASQAFPLLRQARELIMLTGALPAMASRPSIAVEISRRIASLRASGPEQWTPYS
jgi:aminoglycoside phosphotransferase (APT) family kinase protein